jgi:hypothetical protein
MTGSIVLATDQGLGYLAKDFFDNGIIDKVLIHEHSSRPAHREWYPGPAIVPSREVLLEECDTLLFFEEVFDWKIIPQAREKGIKTILMVMYECTRNPLPYVPDLILSPSELDLLYYPESTLVTVPVTPKWRLREKAEVFVHNAGNGGIGGRNGTREILQAMQYVKSPIKLIIRSQVPMSPHPDPRVEIRVGTFDDIWSEGDVFLFPEKFNGLSLPLQEAYASGMLVMAGNRHPMHLWLPNEPLIPVSGFRKERIAVEFDSAIYDPEEIAKTIDLWYNVSITSFSLSGKAWGEANSWPALKDSYIQLANNP